MRHLLQQDVTTAQEDTKEVFQIYGKGCARYRFLLFQRILCIMEAKGGLLRQRKWYNTVNESDQSKKADRRKITFQKDASRLVRP